MTRKAHFVLAAFCALIVSLGTSEQAAFGQLRIVTYNTANGTFPGNDPLPRTGMDNVLQAIANEVTNGIAKPIDVLIFQEHDEPATTTQAFVDLLNGIYGAGTYGRSTVVTQPTSSDIRQTLVYNTNTLGLIAEIAFGTTGSSAAARQTAAFRLRPVGYDSSADFFIYNDHYKSGTTCCDPDSDQGRRNFEAQTVRSNADLLGQGAHIIYAGDYNIRSSTEAMYQTLLAAGNGQAFDPISSPGTWNNSSGFASIHTQSPHDGSDGLVTGGMDDRFDFQLVTGELLDDEGMSYIAGSYHAFGNNGTTFNQAVNAASNTYPLAASILDDLAHVSDHLPVVADYQLPAKMEVTLGAFPTTVNLGDTVNVDVFVENIAPVLFANGADELDYDLTLSNDLLGGAINQVAFPLAGANAHQFSFDTTTTGMKSGTLTVQSNSQSVMDGMFSMLFQYEVIDPGGGFLAADFNMDTFVDSADLAQWEGDYGVNGDSDADGDGDSDGADFLIWQQQDGQSSPLLAASQTVPEPATAWLVLFGLPLLCRVRQRFA